MTTDSGSYRSLLRNRRFTVAIVSMALGNGGYSVYSIAILWLSYQISGSLATAGLVLLVEFGVYSITFVAGPTVDRARNLRTILVVGYVLQAAFAVVIGAALLLGVLNIPLLLALVAGISLVWDFTWTADNALIPRLVSGKDLFRANGIAEAIGGGNAIAGYAAGAGLILFVGPGDAMFLYAALQVAAMLVILPVSLPSSRVLTTRALGDFVEGWRELGRGTGRPLLQFAVFGGFQGLFSQVPPLLLTLFANVGFAEPARAYGFMFTSYAVGGVIGGLLLGHWNPRQRLALLMSGGTALTAALLVAAAYAVPLLLLSIVLWFFVGAAGVAFYAAFVTYLQARVPVDRFGRVLTNVYLFRGIPSAVGAAAVGFLATVWGPRDLALFVAITWTAIAVAGPAVLPALRKLSF